VNKKGLRVMPFFSWREVLCMLAGRGYGVFRLIGKYKNIFPSNRKQVSKNRKVNKKKFPKNMGKISAAIGHRNPNNLKNGVRDFLLYFRDCRNWKNKKCQKPNLN